MDFCSDYHYSTKLEAKDSLEADKILKRDILGKHFTLRVYGESRFYLHRSITYNLWYVCKVINNDILKEFNDPLNVIDFLNSNMVTITNRRFD
jgi:hypothetical protein